MNGKQMLETMLGIEERYHSNRDSESLQIELLDIVPHLKNPGFAQVGEQYQRALVVYNTLREEFPLGIPGIPEIRSNRI